MINRALKKNFHNCYVSFYVASIGGQNLDFDSLVIFFKIF